MKLMVKNMVCDRCKLIVQSICDKLDINTTTIELGKVITAQHLASSQLEQLRDALSETGLILLDDAKQASIEQVKQACLFYLNRQNLGQEQVLSQFIAGRVNKDYNYLSRLFSSVESISIEQYYIALRVEKVKELITYEQLAFSEIAYELGFSSVAHLSRQFKKSTGLTLSEFRTNINSISRQPLDKVKNRQQ